MYCCTAKLALDLNCKPVDDNFVDPLVQTQYMVATEKGHIYICTAKGQCK